LQFAGRVSNLNFIAYPFPGWHLEVLEQMSLCIISKIFNLAENSNRGKKEITWGGERSSN